jgi:hypothetical protein
MCEGSIHVAHRQAKEQETLVVQTIPHHGIKGYYPADGQPNSKLVCIRGITKDAVIHELRIMEGQRCPRGFEKYVGQKNLKVTLIHAGYADWIVFGDDNVNDANKRLALGFVADGVRVDIGIPAITGDKGVDAVKAALVEQDKIGVEKTGLSMTANAIRKRLARFNAKVKAQAKV